MPVLPKISDAEWQVMEVLWMESPQTAAEITHKLEADTRWKPNTVRTLLSRLTKKGVLDYHLEGNRHLYQPLLSRESCLEAEGESFMRRFFKGATHPLLIHFAEKSNLSKSELTKLKQLLEENHD